MMTPNQSSAADAVLSSHNHLDLNDVPQTYTGLLDDVMLRYSDDFTSEDFFRKMIAKNIFFGHGMFINDGYLVNHSIARKHLADENSILRAMLTGGYVRILTRASDGDALAKMPETMAASGNRSFEEFTMDKVWTDFKETFRILAVNAFRCRLEMWT